MYWQIIVDFTAIALNFFGAFVSFMQWRRMEREEDDEPLGRWLRLHKKLYTLILAILILGCGLSVASFIGWAFSPTGLFSQSSRASSKVQFKAQGVGVILSVLWISLHTAFRR